ncbi:MAG: ECF transporter S component [Candidatus Lactobacillus pullistercoris]|uniref:ECF transporter S component n=1 Tax=Candidatus Lactobacillus pullistercoris TaxID=2838636 RepID=A0A9E2NTA2_9LACO|nr:ECF transporter S component [Candidatus Lactobacillus pullistercoris]
MRRKETARLTITAVFVALLLLQTFVPNIGYIRIVPALPAITTIPLTIAIYSSLMGSKAGLGFGLFWGITRLFVAYTQPGDIVSLLIFQNPVISLVPSIIAGWLPGLIVKVIKRKDIGFIFAGLVASLTNTFLVILLTSLFFMNNATVLTSHLGNNTGSNTLFIILVAALGLNGILEAIFTGIVTPIVAIPLRKAFVRLQL